MKHFQQFLRFFVFTNIFIALCTVVMVCQTYKLLLHTSPNLNFLFFVFFSTITSYSFHWYLTAHSVIDSPRIQWVKHNRSLLLLLFFIGIAGSGIFFFFLLPYWHWLLLSAIITFLYSAPKIPHPYFRALRKIALGKTIFLAAVWTHVTIILPLIISNQSWTNEWTIFIISRFFLIYAICILFDYRDREDDKSKGIRSLLTFLSSGAIFYLFAISLILFGITTIWLFQFDYSLLYIIILLLPGIITAGLYNYAKQNFSDFLYYFVLDGMMALSAIILLVPGI